MKGFTLVEQMIVVVIIGIMTAISYSSYVHVLLKSNRTEAQAALTQRQIALERCYAQNFSYIETCASLPAFPQTSDQNHYSITLSNLSRTTYTLTATAIGSQIKDSTCTHFIVSEDHVKISVDSSGARQEHCWL